MDVRMSLRMTRPVTGQQIIDALSKIAGRSFVDEPHVLDDKITHTIGRSSEDEAEDAIIQLKDGNQVDPDKSYDYLEVVHHPWPGAKYAIYVRLERVVAAMKDLRDQLASELAM